MDSRNATKGVEMGRNMVERVRNVVEMGRNVSSLKRGIQQWIEMFRNHGIPVETVPIWVEMVLNLW